MHLLIALLFVGVSFSAELVTIRTKDGRDLTGYYDPDEGALTMLKPKSKVRILPEDIASITPVTAPELTADSPVDLVDQLKRRRTELEADRDKALATARRIRLVVSEARDAAVAKSMEASAISSETEARGYQIKIDEMSAKIDQLEEDSKPVEEATNKPRLSEIGQLRLRLQEAEDEAQVRAEKARSEIHEIQVKLSRMIADANRTFIMTGDLEPVAVKTSARPTKEENDKIMRISRFNTQLEVLRGLREQLKISGTTNRRSKPSLELLHGSGLDEQFWQSYSEFKGKPAPY